ncbi:MAG: PHP domain-containing protein, partial [Clostridia bacterium]|nr:PHP domain-containing protein [Clostridia bacterium]
MTKIREIFPDAPEELLEIEIEKININKSTRVMDILLCGAGSTDSDTARLIAESFKQKFKLSEALVSYMENELSEAELRTRQMEEEIIKKLESQRKNTGPSEVIMGKKIKSALTEIEDITPELGRVRTSGVIFDVEYKQRRDGAWVVTADFTNKKSSITMKFFCDVPMRGDRAAGGFSKPSAAKEKIEKRLKKGVKIAVSADIVYDKYMGDYVLFANDINELPNDEAVKTDDEPQKRVELHVHTQMSAMDGVSSATDLISHAAKWGHKAIAITDHGVVQAFPEAAKAAKKNGIKVIYGVEGYVVDDS